MKKHNDKPPESVPSKSKKKRSSSDNKGLILTGLTELPEKAMLDGAALAKALGVTKRTVRRMVGRYELPPSIRLRGRSMWFAGKVVAYLEAQADRLARNAEKNAVNFRRILS